MATALARLQDLDSIEAVHVFCEPSAIPYDEHVNEGRGNEHREIDDFLVRVNTHGVSVDPTFVESNQPGDAILRRAEQMKSDLIVMSTRGRSSAEAVLLGSATAHTIAEATMPVLAIKHFGPHLNIFEAIQASRFWTQENSRVN